MKNLKINYIRYYMCGEYGPKTDRAHYHMIVFGLDFKDKKHHTTSRSTIDAKIYISRTLDKIWGKGDCYIGEVTFESAAYVARYIMKKINGQQAEKHYERIDALTGEIIKRQPEYTRMSLKPGIGSRWLKKYEQDVYPEGTVLARGHKSKAPKYYDLIYKKTKPLEHDDLLAARELQSNRADNVADRLATRERVARAKAAFLKRNDH
ncbi:MAG: replication initiator protein [Microviridae sp.]|nr:MAG: replication initiator protein [Microviridae sp.]